MKLKFTVIAENNKPLTEELVKVEAERIVWLLNHGIHTMQTLDLFMNGEDRLDEELTVIDAELME